MNPEHQVWTKDCNGIVIDFGGDSLDPSILLMDHAQNNPVAMNETSYIRVTAGAKPNADGNYQTTLESGTFAVVESAFLERMKHFYKLEVRGREWYSDNKAITAAEVKQKILVTLLPFGIAERERTYLYKSLQNYCARFDSHVEPLKIVTAAELNSKLFQRPPYIVESLLYPGVTILAAPPKTGKSFLVLDLACCVAEGKPFWGYNTTQGDVLYLDLESMEWSTQTRLPVVGRKSAQDCPDSLSIVYEKVKNIDNGLIEQLNGWISAAKNPRLIIIDTLVYVKSKLKRGESIYEAESAAIGKLNDLGNKNNIAIIAVTHTHKSSGRGDEDPLEKINGSMGISGSANGIWNIDGPRKDAKKKFFATGKNIGQVELEIESKDCRWVCHGTLEDAQERDRKALYERDPTAAFIREHLAKCGGRWSCTAQQIIDEATKAGVPLELDPTRLSQRLRLIAPQMEQYGNIIVLFPSGGGRHGREFTFEQIK